MNARLIAIATLIVLGFVWIIVAYARLCLCDSCKAPFAVYSIHELQYCRGCYRSWSRVRDRYGRRRSLLRRIFRAAA